MIISPFAFTSLRRTEGIWPEEVFISEPPQSFSAFALSIVKSTSLLHDGDCTCVCVKPLDKETGACKASLQETAFIEPVPSAAPAPSDIYAVYSDDLNIIKIHEAVCAKFANLFHIAPNELEEIEEEIERVQDPATPMTIAERSFTIDNLRQRKEYLKTIVDRSVWNEYRDAVKEILISYVPFASDEARGAVTIGGVEASIQNENETRERRLEIIRSYIEVAKNYISISAFYSGSNFATCPVCNAFVKDAQYQDDYGTFVCACGRESTAVVRAATFRDNIRIDTGIKNTYSSLGNFIKRIDAFEGKQKNSKPPLMLYTQLREYLNAKNAALGWPSTEEIARMPLDEDGKKPMTSIEILTDALVNTENSGFYSDFELIAHVLWGWRLADLSANGLRRQLIADYIMTQKVYEEIKERGSSLNVNLRLYYHLRARDYTCSIADFKTVSSPDSIDYHHRMFEEMSRRTRLKYVPIQ